MPRLRHSMESKYFPSVLQRRLLLVAEQLKEPGLTDEACLALIEQLCGLLEVETTVDGNY